MEDRLKKFEDLDKQATRNRQTMMRQQQMRQQFVQIRNFFENRIPARRIVNHQDNNQNHHRMQNQQNNRPTDGSCRRRLFNRNPKK